MKIKLCKRIRCSDFLLNIFFAVSICSIFIANWLLDEGLNGSLYRSTAAYVHIALRH